RQGGSDSKAASSQATLRCPSRLFSTQAHSGDHSDEQGSNNYCSAQFSGGGDNSSDLSDNEQQLKETTTQATALDR
ncbi:unnamed protein product, partial [Ilex paraguariensis]